MVWKGGAGNQHIFVRGTKEPLGNLLAPNIKAIEEFDPEYITARDVFLSTPRRVLGRYGHRTAEAELVFTNGGTCYELDIKCTEIVDAQELYLLIRTGKDRPKISFENEQTPKSIGRIRKLIHRIGQFFVRVDAKVRLGQKF